MNQKLVPIVAHPAERATVEARLRDAGFSVEPSARGGARSAVRIRVGSPDRDEIERIAAEVSGVVLGPAGSPVRNIPKYREDI